MGFRYFAKRTADRFGLAGFVKNRFDGSVEIYAEGDEQVLKDFANEIKIGPSHAHVSGMEMAWGAGSGQYKEFRIEI